jgi:hypothetical protein
MSYLIPPAGATDKQKETFIASLRSEARTRVRQMMADGASEDEIADYIRSIESDDMTETTVEE